MGWGARLGRWWYAASASCMACCSRKVPASISRLVWIQQCYVGRGRHHQSYSPGHGSFALTLLLVGWAASSTRRLRWCRGRAPHSVTSRLRACGPCGGSSGQGSASRLRLTRCRRRRSYSPRPRLTWSGQGSSSPWLVACRHHYSPRPRLTVRLTAQDRVQARVHRQGLCGRAPRSASRSPGSWFLQCVWAEAAQRHGARCLHLGQRHPELRGSAWCTTACSSTSWAARWVLRAVSRRLRHGECCGLVGVGVHLGQGGCRHGSSRRHRHGSCALLGSWLVYIGMGCSWRTRRWVRW